MNTREINMDDMIVRPQSEFMNSILGAKFPVLDHGYIRVIDYMGTDSCVADAAGMSYGKGTKKMSDANSLIRYLLNHSHTSPFEMVEIKVEVQLPIFVARQWIRHRMANVNEYSARYSVMEKLFYVPEANQIQYQSKDNKQGKAGAVTQHQALRFQLYTLENSERTYAVYEDMISPENDISRELARINLPVNIYTKWIWKIDVHNMMHFLCLRADNHAQYEVRVYAEKMLEIMEKWIPFTFAAMQDYVINSIKFSAGEIELLKHMAKMNPHSLSGIASEIPDDFIKANTSLSLREWKEFKAKLDKLS